jgi:sulfite reductase alpha subunit-like flavoprotein
MAPSATESEAAARGSGRLLVLYASQTGNAMDAAERVGREAERGGCPVVEALSMDSFDPVSSNS